MIRVNAETRMAVHTHTHTHGSVLINKKRVGGFNE